MSPDSDVSRSGSIYTIVPLTTGASINCPSREATNSEYVAVMPWTEGCHLTNRMTSSSKSQNCAPEPPASPGGTPRSHRAFGTECLEISPMEEYYSSTTHCTKHSIATEPTSRLLCFKSLCDDTRHPAPPRSFRSEAIDVNCSSAASRSSAISSAMRSGSSRSAESSSVLSRIQERSRFAPSRRMISSWV